MSAICEWVCFLNPEAPFFLIALGILVRMLFVRFQLNKAEEIITNKGGHWCDCVPSGVIFFQFWKWDIKHFLNR